jgi:hypothetical protein
LGNTEKLQQESLAFPAEQRHEVFQLTSEEGMEIFDSHPNFFSLPFYLPNICHGFFSTRVCWIKTSFTQKIVLFVQHIALSRKN